MTHPAAGKIVKSSKLSPRFTGLHHQNWSTPGGWRPLAQHL